VNNIEADNQAEALGKIPGILERSDKLGNPLIKAIKADSPEPVPTKIDIKPVAAPPPVREGRFLLQGSADRKGWVVTDLDYGVVVTFRNHRFNATKKITFLNDIPTDHLVTARILREMGDWLGENHKDKIV
jgi:hypothetical protein